MKTIKRKSYKKKLLITASAAVVVIAGAITSYALVQSHQSTPKTSPAKSTSTQTTQTPTTNATKTGLVVPDSQSQKTTDQIPVSSTLTATITTLNESNNVVNFAGSVNSTDPSGQCYVEFSNPNDKSVIPPITAKVGSDSTTCGPVQVSADDFTYLGNWTVTFRYYTNNSQVVATGNINIQ